MGSKSHKDPKDRANLWQRPKRDDEQPSPKFAGYDIELPRYLHRYTADGAVESKIVATPEDCDDAFAEGWELHLHDPFVAPEPPTVE